MPLLVRSEPLTNRQLGQWIEEASPDELAVIVSAKVGMHPADYREVFETRWAGLGADASTPPRSDS